LTTVAVMPARFASTRFPGKPLAKETGRFLIQHVCERVLAAKRVDRAIVATDDQRIIEAVRSFGGEARMTRSDHVSGTDRVAEVAAALKLRDRDLVLNVQGDEPEIEPASLDELVARMNRADHGCGIGTLAAPFDREAPRSGPGSPKDPNCVKVVVDALGRALYFSRSLIPYPRDTGGEVDHPELWLLHLGVYAFRPDVLQKIGGDLPSRGLLPERPPVLDRAESLEQLRWLAGGMSIAVALVDRGAVGIDTPEDYAAFVRRIRACAAT
jgi:3-deoxy-manno-octulosonate cytidylyltransferase (CMP-KDO synthetase)